MKQTKICALICIVLFGYSFSWPEKLEQKVNATIAKTFQLEEFELTPFVVDEATEAATIKEINKNLYKINTGEAHLGYIYVGEAPSMKNVFDYAILFSPELEVVNAKVLIYREKHGRQIGMKRWLKQFFGMTPDSSPELGKNIDGISGATISVNSMTNAVNEVLASIRFLRTSKLL